MTFYSFPEPANPFFLQCEAGDIFCIYYPPNNRREKNEDVLLIPPFAEEMNKSRKMFAMQARLLNSLGYGVLIVDLYGTGDSHGNFREASWEIWCANISSAIKWLNNHGADSISLLGLRFGALLAMAQIRQTTTKIKRIILWQAVVNGKNMITQFLRLRVAASMMSAAKSKESTTMLRQLSKENQSIEVAGYELSSRLISDLDSIELSSLVETDSPPIYWFELVPDKDRQHSPISQKIIEHWRSLKISVHPTLIVGEFFWSSLEITYSQNLLQATTEIFRQEG